jgi:hypothetical protein
MSNLLDTSALVKFCRRSPVGRELRTRAAQRSPGQGRCRAGVPGSWSDPPSHAHSAELVRFSQNWQSAGQAGLLADVRIKCYEKRHSWEVQRLTIAFKIGISIPIPGTSPQRNEPSGPGSNSAATPRAFGGQSRTTGVGDVVAGVRVDQICHGHSARLSSLNSAN